MEVRTKVRVVVAGPLPATRASLSRIVESAWGWLVVGEASDGFEAVGVSRAQEADLLLVDDRIGGLPVREIRTLLASTPTLVVCLLEQPGQSARQSGPSVLKSVPASAQQEYVVNHLHQHWSRRSRLPELRR